ncbi:MAG: VOC family protein [Paludibacterium sp.]|uniref:VOC family protein n=1 Tax=Paludibacterium sp. TaxID=1917523 RepID=UPI0025E3EC03|nr:VOC family protein [Paludibacterium sp.]MBV8047131.1 VOC family protein [Paludibacterium sp.]MBV8648738.1 VOC family protein [Paludibacterium sp.]
MNVLPYVFFHGRGEEAIAFYQQALNAEVLMMLRFKDAPPNAGRAPEPGTEDKIMHATLQIGTSQLQLSDGDCGTTAVPHAGFSLSLNLDDAATGERCFQALAQGGQITLPFQATFWSPGFGMLVDRFGIAWMVNVGRPNQ